VRGFFAFAVALMLLTNAAAASVRSPKDPTLRARPADVALAKQLLIRLSDLPAGFTDKGLDRSGDSNSNFSCPGVTQPDLHRLILTADVNSHQFQRESATTGFSQISSEASLFRSASDAYASVEWIVRLPTSTMQRCLAAVARAGLPNSARPAIHVTTARRRIGDLRIFTWEIRAVVRNGAVRLPIDVTLGGYLRGRAAIMLTITTAGPPPDLTLIRSLAQTTASRLEHARL
jgi:hypothetical protein